MTQRSRSLPGCARKSDHHGAKNGSSLESDRMQAAVATSFAVPLSAELLFESSPDCAKVLDLDGNLLAMNRNGQCLMDVDDISQVCGLPWTSLWPGESRSQIESALEQARQGQLGHFVASAPTAKGVPKIWDVRVSPIHGVDGRLQGFLSVSRDITTLQELLRLRQRSEILSEAQKVAMEQAVSGAPLEQVLGTLVRAAEAHSEGAMLVSVLIAQDGNLRHGAAPSLPRAYNGAIDGIKIGPNVGSCGTAAHFNREVVVSDIATDPLWVDYKELALSHGLRSCWSQPIRSPGGALLGTLACYRRERHAPTPAEREAVALLVNTAALILDHRREIEERRATQEALLRSEQRFRLFVTATSQMIWTTNAQGLVVEDSPSWRAFTGQTYEEWKHHGWLEALHPDDRQATLAAWHDSLAARGVFEAEYRVRHADGDYRWTAARGVPVLAQDGSVCEWVGSNTDITERKKVENERQRFVSLAERSNDFIGMADLSLRPFFVNRSGLEMVGLDSVEQALATPVTDFFFPEDRSFIADEFLPRTVREGSGEVEIRFRHFKTGEALWMIYSVYGVKDPQGHLIGHATVSRNITERKQAEEELRRLATRLTEADHRKTEFLATLAHELRNPLAPIRNGLEVLRLAGDKPETAAKVREMMQRQLSHMVHLIEDLLDVARINSGKVELRREKVEVRAIVTGAVESSLAAIDAAHHALDLRITDETLVVDADPVRLVQVLGNLLTNAAKYTPERGRIELSVGREGQHAVIAVSDNGIGIPPQALPTLFEMFTQVPNNAARSQGGLGIGLSLVRRLVEMHGGTVTAASPGEGKGSTFTVRLPTVEHQQLEVTPKQHRTQPLGKTGLALKVVVADDNIDAAESLATLLGLGGHQVFVAHDGHDAVRQVLEHRPDLAILDIGMPGLTGYEVARVIRQTPGMKSISLIALTGWGADHDQEQARTAGFNHHLTKPADLAAIDAVLSARGGT